MDSQFLLCFQLIRVCISNKWFVCSRGGVQVWSCVCLPVGMVPQAMDKQALGNPELMHATQILILALALTD